MDQTLPRLVVGLPHLASLVGGESILEGRKGLLSDLAKKSKVFRLSPSPPSLSPEAAWLGLDPEVWSFSQGPLTFSWLRLSPPERSLAFHLTIGCLKDEKLADCTPIDRREADLVAEALKRLDSPKASFIQGRGMDHGLISLSGSQETFSTPWSEAVERDWREVMPWGDDGALLRTWIEDAHELLSRLEFNRRRMGEGQKEANIAWPWGQGAPAKGMNLPLRRGFVVRHMTGSIRVAGLARIFGERVVWREGLSAQGVLHSHEPTVMVVEGPGRARMSGDLDAVEECLREIESQLLKPLLEAKDPALRLTILAPMDAFGVLPPLLGHGIGLNYDSRRTEVFRQLPFDERVIAESEGKSFPLHEAVSVALSGG